ncbi:kinase-like domain-containing protein [Pavlovales sp. CCMP2436]|nr:kinase-like domain-containing protein [Pavlovales sp. CCMP2436]
MYMAKGPLMMRNRSAPGTVGRELSAMQSRGLDLADVPEGPRPSEGLSRARRTSDGTSEGPVDVRPVTGLSAGLSMMTSAFSNRPSPALTAVKRRSAKTENFGGSFGGGLRRQVVSHSGGGSPKRDGTGIDVPLPRQYADDIGRTPDTLEASSRICYLAARGELEQLKRRVAALPAGRLGGVSSLDNRMPLHFAAAAGHFTVCEWLLEQGVAVNPVDGFGLTPLAEAVRFSHREVARMLHGKGGRLWISGELVTYHNFDAQVPLLNASMTDEDWEIGVEELRTEGMIGQGSFGLIFKATWRGTPVAIKQIQIRKGTVGPHSPAGQVFKREQPLPPVRAKTLNAYEPPYPTIAGSTNTNNGVASSSGIQVAPAHGSSTSLGLHTGGSTNYGTNKPPSGMAVALQFLGAVTKPGPHSPAIVMELATSTLAQTFREQGRLSFADAMASSIHVARGMAYLHGHQPNAIIHRDLKPSNVLRTAAGLWKVFFFFFFFRLMPRSLEDIYHNAYVIFPAGSYVYMAPEVYKHETYNLKVDQYAYSMIVYQAFQHERPFKALRPVDAARAASTGRRPAELGGLCGPMRAVVTQCWSAEPSKRPNFADLVPLLCDYASSRGLTADSNYSHYGGLASSLGCVWRGSSPSCSVM